MDSLTIFNSESDEDNWLIQIDQLVSETNLTLLNKVPVCIYHVPKSLSCAKPEAFTPQLIAIGPYNHFRPELYPMERFKVFSAKRILDYFKKHDLKQLVKELHSTSPYIRACYHKHLDLKDDTLLYTIVIDALFLLDFCHNYVADQKGSSSSFLTGLEQVVEISGVKLTKDAIVRDLLMLENQIPTYTLMRIMMIETSKPSDSVQKELGSMLLSFGEKHCPFKLTQIPMTCPEAVTKPYHLLDLLYHLVVSHHENSQPPLPEGIYNTVHVNDSSTPNSTFKRSSKSGGIVTIFKKVKGPLNWTLGALKKLKEMDIPVLKPIKRHMDAILKVSSLQWNSSETSSESEAPVVVTIPFVSELFSVGIRCKPSKGGIMTIEFDERKGIFYLPVIKVDVNSEVIMRNLVAHEALTKPDFLIFTRYTDLMREIIDTVEDVQLLKEAGIIESSSTLSVREIEKLFNGMSKSIRPTKTEKLDETIKKVNKHFQAKQKVNLYRAITQYVYSSWKLFTLLATFALLAMTALQTFCTVYDCPSLLKDK